MQPTWKEFKYRQGYAKGECLKVVSSNGNIGNRNQNRLNVVMNPPVGADVFVGNNNVQDDVIYRAVTSKTKNYEVHTRTHHPIW